MSSPILVGVDGSPAASHALDWAVAEAARRDRPLHIVHILELRPYDIPRFPAPDTRDVLVSAARKILDEARASAERQAPGLTVDTELVTGGAAATLIDKAAAGYEVVIGNRGRGGFASMLLGSVSLQVATHATAPVIIVRGEPGGDRTDIVIGVERPEHCAEALPYAFEAAALRGARLRILHAWEAPGILYPPDYPFDVTALSDEAQREIEEIARTWGEKYPGVEIVAEAVRDHPVSALVEASRTAALVVVGAHSTGALRRAVIGSVSHGVVHHAHCPVAVVRHAVNGTEPGAPAGQE